MLRFVTSVLNFVTSALGLRASLAGQTRQPCQKSLAALLATGLATGLAAVSTWGMGSSPTLAAPQVVTTIAQIGQPLSEIAGDCLEVKSLLGPGSDPHLYRPTRSDMASLLQADVLVHNGAHLEAQFAQPLAQFAKRKPVFELAAYVPLAGLMQDGAQTTDPHFWMSPALWGFLVNNLVEDMLADSRVTDRLGQQCLQTMRAASLAYQHRLEALDAWAQAIFSDLPDDRRLLVTAHDAFGYFGQRYAFQVEGIQGLSTDSQASLKRMNDLARLLVDRQIPVAFVESSIDPKSIQSLLSRTAALGGNVGLGLPLYSDAMGAQGSQEALYVGMFAHNVRAMAQGFGLQTPLLELDVLAPDFSARLIGLGVSRACQDRDQGRDQDRNQDQAEDNHNGDTAC